MPGGLTIANITHPRYDLRYREWRKWRLVYHGGPQMIEQYLVQFTNREDPQEFQQRKNMTYCPSFAKAAVNDVKNSIYQRMSDITRSGGSNPYHNACAGLDNGIDLLGNTMSSYLGQKVLPELLTMGRVGVYVDMPMIDPDASILEGSGKRPYIYLYETEDIRSWTYDDSSAPNEFGSLLLRDYIYDYDKRTGLPKGQGVRFRHYWLDEDGSVYVQFYEGDGTDIGQSSDIDSMESSEPIRLPIKRIPFVILEITDSLLTDIANYQIALLNIESSDISYILKANFPFYTEQYEPRSTSLHVRPGGIDAPGQASTAQASQQREITPGISQGRMYPMSAERPGFIHPSSEPLKASMEKQQQIKSDIRFLLGLAITNLMPRATSAEAKGFDERSLESGLSAIGLELERAERMIASYWAMYEKSEPAIVKYPDRYDLKSDKDRFEEGINLSKLIDQVPSKSYSKEVAKRLAYSILGNRVSQDRLKEIEKEIDAAPGITSNSEQIKTDLEAGVCDPETAAKLRGYPAGTVEKANEAHAERLARIQEAQTSPEASQQNDAAGARGIKDADPSMGESARKEKTDSRDPSNKGVPDSGTRGKGKAPRKDKVSE